MTHHIQRDIQGEQITVVPASSIAGVFRKEKEIEEKK